MYPDNPAQSNTDNRNKIIFVAVAAALLLLLLILLLARQDTEPRALKSTNLQANDNFGHLIGSGLYFYNGVAFQRVNYATGEKDNLASGFKLPEPRHVFWSAEGVMLNFASSFLLSDVQTSLENQGFSLNDETERYTWYLDFSSSELVLVEKSAVNSGQAFYSEDDGGFYYVSSSVDESRQIISTLSFFSVNSGEKRVVVENLDLVDISYIGGCLGDKICIIARQRDNVASERLFAINESGTLQEVFDSGGRLFATSMNDRFVRLVDSDADTEHAEGTPEEVSYADESAVLYDVGSGSEQSLGFKIGDSEIIVGFTSDDKFYVIDDLLEANLSSDDAYYYRAGSLDGWFGRPSIANVPLEHVDGSPFTGRIIPSASFGSSGDSLIPSFAGDQLLFSAADRTIGGLDMLGEPEAQRNVDECVSSTGAEEVDYFSSNRLFRVYFTNNDDFHENIEAFSDCIVDSNTLGYDYYFGGLDPVNERIVTD